MTVAELKQRMTIREFKSWIAYNRISPIGDERTDTLAAQIVTAICASGGVKTTIERMRLKWFDPLPTPEELAEKLGTALDFYAAGTKAKQQGK